MSWKTATQVYRFGRGDNKAVLGVDAGTGSVVFESSGDGTTYITEDTFTSDTRKVIDVSVTPFVRVSVTGDAKYFFDAV